MESEWQRGGAAATAADASSVQPQEGATLRTVLHPWSLVCCCVSRETLYNSMISVSFDNYMKPSTKALNSTLRRWGSCSMRNESKPRYSLGGESAALVILAVCSRTNFKTALEVFCSCADQDATSDFLESDIFGPQDNPQQRQDDDSSPRKSRNRER